MIKKTLKSVGAVLAGFFTVFILSVVTDVILEATGVFPPQANPAAYATWMLALALAYRSIYTVIGGYVTAQIAPRKPMLHVLALMILGGIGGVAGAIAGWDIGAHWYCISIAVTGPFFVWVGGKLNKKTARS